MSWLFSQALVEAFSEDQSSDGEPCAQLNVVPTAQPFWHRDKPMDASRFSRFGLTLQLLTADHGEDLLTWYRADFLARISASPAAETGSTENAPDSGAKWPASFATWDRDSSTWRTAQCSLLGGLDEYSETWPTSGSMRSGTCWERLTLEPPISENESGLLPTPVAIDTGSRFNRSVSDGASLRPTLGAMARFDLWPTPTASLGTKGGRVTPRKGREGGTLIEAVSARHWPTPTVKGNYNRKGLSSKSGDGLATAVLKWPTPTARDYRGVHRTERGQERRQESSRGMPLNEEVGGLLNPEWVEWLMGWPIGWTALQPLEMDRFREWQQQHGGY